MSSLYFYAMLLLTFLVGISAKGLATSTEGSALMQTGKAAPAVLPRIHRLQEFDGNEMESMLLAEDGDGVEIDTEAKPNSHSFAKEVGDSNSNTIESATLAAVILDFLALLPNILVAATAILSVRILGLVLMPALFSHTSPKQLEDDDHDEDSEIIDDEPGSMDARTFYQSKQNRAAQKTDECGCTALHMAAHGGQLTELMKLLEAGADPNAREVWGEMPLHMAARAGNTEACATLLAHGADLDAVNDNGETPLVVAAQESHEITCKFLLGRGAGAGNADDVKMPPMLCSLLMLDLLPKAATSPSEPCDA